MLNGIVSTCGVGYIATYVFPSFVPVRSIPGMKGNPLLPNRLSIFPQRLKGLTTTLYSNTYDPLVSSGLFSYYICT